MSAFNFDSLRSHVGHHITCVEYGNKETGCINIAVECEDCGEVILDYDKPADKGYVPFKNIDASKMKLRCPQCGEYSTIDEWNERTQDSFGGKITPLVEDDFDDNGIANKNTEAFGCEYTCPCCDLDVFGRELKVKKVSR